jgi:hypothetical protein
MTVELKVKNIDAVVWSLTQQESLIEKSLAYAIGQAGLATEREVKLVVVSGGGRHKRGTKTPATPGGPPASITGNLQRSVKTEIMRGFGGYTAEVFPTAVYSRAVDMGSDRWTSGVKYPYMQQAYDSMKPRLQDIFSKAFARKWNRG